MAVSKRLRFEVLRRDNHTCRYCGATAPGVKLVVDHVRPEALGGRAEPENLVTSCEPCNSGKTSTAPDSPLVAQVAADALRWSRAIHQTALEMLAKRDQREAELKEFATAWAADRRRVRLPDGWESSILRFRSSGLPLPLIIDAARKALGNQKIPAAGVFRYMCGIAWNTVKDLQQQAAQHLAVDEGGCGISEDEREPSARDQVADTLLRLIEDHRPAIAFQAASSAPNELADPSEERSLAGEESTHVLAVAIAIHELLGQLQIFEWAVERGFRRLSAVDRERIVERLAHDVRCAGEDVTELDLSVHRLRHILALLVETEEAG